MFLVVQACGRLVLLLVVVLALVTVSCDRAEDQPIPGSEDAPIQLSPGGMTYEPSDGDATVQPADFGTVEPDT